MGYRRAKLAFVVAAVAVACWAAYSGVCREPDGGPQAAPKKAEEGERAALPRQVQLQGAGVLRYMVLEPSERAAMILYCGVTHGMIEVCGCDGNPTGGMIKELTVIERLRSRGVPSFYVHPGDLFPYEKRPAKMKFIAEAAALIGYDALGFGDQELIDGLPRFRQLASEYHLPFLSANVRDRDGKPLCPPYVIKDLAGIKVGIFALLGDERYLYMDENFLKDMTIDPVSVAVDVTLAELKGKVDYIILLSHQDKYLDRELALRFPEINLIVGGHEEKLIATPVRVGQTLIVAAGVASEEIGVLHLAVDPARHVRVVGHEFVAVSAPIPKNEKMEEIYRRYIKESKAKPEEDDDPLPEAYQSSETCEPCHKAVYKEFLESKHAKAWQTLVDAGRVEDTECWYCHSMGYGRKSGFKDLKQTPELANVSCQACHLVTHDHNDRNIKDDLDYSRNQRTCEQCHTAVTSPDFNFWERIEEIDHHKVKEKSNDPPADYKHWRVTPVHKAPPSAKPAQEKKPAAPSKTPAAAPAS
jgi:hypothetical protein